MYWKTSQLIVMISYVFNPRQSYLWLVLLSLFFENRYFTCLNLTFIDKNQNGMTSFHVIKILRNFSLNLSHLWLFWKYFRYVCVTNGYVLKGISEDYINVIENTSKNTKKNMCWNEIKLLFYRTFLLSWAEVKKHQV